MTTTTTTTTKTLYHESATVSDDEGFVTESSWSNEDEQDDDEDDNYSDLSSSSMEERDRVLQELEEMLELIEDNDDFLLFVSEEGLEDVLDFMVAFPDDADIHFASSLVLVHLFRLECTTDTTSARGTGRTHQPLLQTYASPSSMMISVSTDFLQSTLLRLVEAGIVETVGVSIQRFANHQRIQTFLLATLLRVTHPRYLGMKHYHRVDPTIIAQWAIRTLNGHNECQRFVLAVLGSIFSRSRQDPSFRTGLLEADILEALQPILSNYKANVSIMRITLQLLFVLTDKNPNCRGLILQGGFVPHLTRAIRKHLDHDFALLLAACGILWHLANENDQAKVLIAQNRGIEYLTRILLRHPEHWKVQVLAVGALCSVSLSQDPIVGEILVTSLARDALGTAMYHHHDLDMVVDAAMIALTRIEEFTTELLHEALSTIH